MIQGIEPKTGKKFTLFSAIKEIIVQYIQKDKKYFVVFMENVSLCVLVDFLAKERQKESALYARIKSSSGISICQVRGQCAWHRTKQKNKEKRSSCHGKQWEKRWLEESNLSDPDIRWVCAS
ncbi:MAG: hypothetical protein ACI4P4_07215 [Faecousia sp.]